MNHQRPVKLPEFPKRIYHVHREVWCDWVETLPPKSLRNRSSETLGYYDYDSNAGVLAGVRTWYTEKQVADMLRRGSIILET